MSSADKKCAPGKKFIGNSCISKSILNNIANMLNNMFIKNENDKIDINLNKKQLVSAITRTLSSYCSSQRCWTQLPIINNLNESSKEELHKSTWLPNGPKGKHEWLSTTHINDKLTQYHHVYPEFIFLGAVPLDFNDINQLGINNINFYELCIKKKKSKIGIVFNHDTSNKGGSHWVSMYVDLLKGRINYFDSVGEPPKREVKKLINKLIKASYFILFKKKIDINNILFNCKHNRLIDPNLNKMDIRCNTNQHQFKGSECGVYSLHFIIESLKGRTFDDITNDIVKDDHMNKNREDYFIIE